MDQHDDQETLYNQGIHAFRAARWDEAIKAFSKLEAQYGSTPETERLLADAQLKIGIDQAEMPLASIQPKQKRWIPVISIIAVAICLIAGVAGLLSMKTSDLPVAQNVVAAITLPTIAPTSTPTPMPTATLMPTTSALGTIQVRWAGQQGSHSIKNIEIILDASGSMLGRTGGIRRIDIAHQALESMIQQLPSNSQIALRTYGRRRSNDCTDTELVQPIMPINQAQLLEQIKQIVPVARAKTPLALSIEQVITDTQGVTGDVSVIIVSDGDETCDGDPVQIASQIHTANPNIRINVIGFNVEPEAWRARLRAIAEEGSGNYFDAADTQQLADALHTVAMPRFSIFRAQHDMLASGDFGQSIEAPQGTYRIVIDGIDTPLENIRIQNGTATVIDVEEVNGKLQANPQPISTSKP